jgi:hypothetical protein
MKLGVVTAWFDLKSDGTRLLIGLSCKICGCDLIPATSAGRGVVAEFSEPQPDKPTSMASTAIEVNARSSGQGIRMVEFSNDPKIDEFQDGVRTLPGLLGRRRTFKSVTVRS